MAYDAGYLARQMKKMRIDKGWDQQQLADAAGISKDSIARYEAQMNTPSFSAVCKIAEAFGCETDDLRPRGD